jgi:hypothetical protein
VVRDARVLLLGWPFFVWLWCLQQGGEGGTEDALLAGKGPHALLFV